MKGHVEAALACAAQGWYVFQARFKLSKPGKWTKQGRWSGKRKNGLNWAMTKDPEEIQRLWTMYPDDPLGIPTGSVNGFFVLDVDTPSVTGHKHDGFTALRALEDRHGPLPSTLMAESPTGSVHYYFKLPMGKKIKNSASDILIEGETRALGIDIRGEGGMVIAPPSSHPSGGQYRWLNGLDIAQAPRWLVELVPKSGEDSRKRRVAQPQASTKREAADILTPTEAAMMRADRGAGISLRPEDNPFVYLPEPAKEIELKIRAALSVIPSDDYEIWYRIGGAIHTALGDAGYKLFDEWSQQSTKYDPRECERKWRDCGHLRSIGIETVFWYADQFDRGWRALYRGLLSGEVTA
ncbi:bifunctional DNA primase/polymerase [Bradyrhizobium pachyrhizi]|uniref:bifunctional DNA primase/polymerase n=1 Tax=Bradyrhizobium pachyrhizi TaxID=280333 RepID=UPI00067D32DB|nr:bifunctional DNA primase/polymerase [Bradyrhizobium pachyrhizi]